MRKYTPVGLSDIKNVARVMVENFNRISASINSIQTRIGSTDNSISRISQDGASNSSSIANLEARSSLTVIYEVSDVTAPLFSPPFSTIGIDQVGKEIKINEQSFSIDIPDISNITYIDIFFSTSKFLSIKVDSVSFASSVYTALWTTSNSIGTIAVVDECSVTFHW